MVVLYCSDIVVVIFWSVCRLQSSASLFEVAVSSLVQSYATNNWSLLVALRHSSDMPQRLFSCFTL